LLVAVDPMNVVKNIRCLFGYISTQTISLSVVWNDDQRIQ
jgi:hypothetical protein